MWLRLDFSIYVLSFIYQVSIFLVKTTLFSCFCHYGNPKIEITYIYLSRVMLIRLQKHFRPISIMVIDVLRDKQIFRVLLNLHGDVMKSLVDFRVMISLHLSPPVLASFQYRCNYSIRVDIRLVQTYLSIHTDT